MSDVARKVEEIYGPTITMDRKGKVRMPRGYKLGKRKTKAAEQPEPDQSQKQVDRVQPPGRPLERWGDREVEITPEDVAQAILEFNERVPEAAGLLQAGSEG